MRSLLLALLLGLPVLLINAILLILIHHVIIYNNDWGCLCQTTNTTTTPTTPPPSTTPHSTTTPSWVIPWLPERGPGDTLYHVWDQHPGKHVASDSKDDRDATNYWCFWGLSSGWLTKQQHNTCSRKRAWQTTLPIVFCNQLCACTLSFIYWRGVVEIDARKSQSARTFIVKLSY